MYEIIIKHHTTKKVTKREYGVIERRPYTEEEINKSNSYWNNDDMRKEIKEVMGHRPPVEVEEKESRDIYRQEVDDLDLAAVIIAVNKLQQIVMSEEERADRLEAMVDRMSETISECVLLIWPMYDLIQQIEICGASPELTKAVTMASDIMHKLMDATGCKTLPERK